MLGSRMSASSDVPAQQSPPAIGPAEMTAAAGISPATAIRPIRPQGTKTAAHSTTRERAVSMAASVIFLT